MDFAGKVIWITGASSGIGMALSKALQERGAKLIVSGRNKPQLEQLVSSFNTPNLHNILVFDTTDIAQNENLVERAWDYNGHVDILINNAGISQRSLAVETHLEVDRKVMEVDYFAPISLSKSILPKFINRRSGCIINIVSVAGKLGSPMRSAYSGAKHALIGFMDCLRAEVFEYGIRVINVCPGFVKTHISENALTGDLTRYAQLDPEIASGMSADKFAQLLLRKLKGNKVEIIIASGLPKLGYQFRRFLPNMFHFMLPKIYKKR